MDRLLDPWQTTCCLGSSWHGPFERTGAWPAPKRLFFSVALVVYILSGTRFLLTLLHGYLVAIRPPLPKTRRQVPGNADILRLQLSNGRGLRQDRCARGSSSSSLTKFGNVQIGRTGRIANKDAGSGGAEGKIQKGTFRAIAGTRVVVSHED